MRIPCQPIHGGEPFECFKNVQKRIKALGGKAAFGWAIRDDGPNDIVEVKYSHVVWESETGELFDVTPQIVGIEGEFAIVSYPDSIKFEQDDTAVFESKSLGTKYIPKIDNPHLERACKHMERADALLLQGDLDKCRYWTEKANTELQRGKLQAGWDTPASLLMRDVLPTML